MIASFWQNSSICHILRPIQLSLLVVLNKQQINRKKQWRGNYFWTGEGKTESAKVGNAK